MTSRRFVTINQINKDIKLLQSQNAGYKLARLRLFGKLGWLSQLNKYAVIHKSKTLFDDYTRKKQPLSVLRQRMESITYSIHLLDEDIKDANNTIKLLNNMRKDKYEKYKPYVSPH